jgi:hypothetical protein
MLTATGTLVYDPRVVVDGREHFDPWWVVLECGVALLGAPRAALEAEGVRLTRPRWGSHVSVVSGEEPPRKERWRFGHGELVPFAYDPTPRLEGAFYFLDVICDELCDLREALGLPRAPRHPFHLTLGRTKEPRAPKGE